MIGGCSSEFGAPFRHPSLLWRKPQTPARDRVTRHSTCVKVVSKTIISIARKAADGHQIRLHQRLLHQLQILCHVPQGVACEVEQAT